MSSCCHSCVDEDDFADDVGSCRKPEENRIERYLYLHCSCSSRKQLMKNDDKVLVAAVMYADSVLMGY